ncbi:MAG TPA: hypothetical protein PLB31_07245 [Fimbriimonadaceae bacterium]|nr:hypothetical protein [Fimbriimonadaceae bacterium]
MGAGMEPAPPIQAKEPWGQRLKDTVSSGDLPVLCAAFAHLVVGVVMTQPDSLRLGPGLMLLALPLAGAVLVQLLLMVGVPALFGQEGYRMPQPFTIPLVFGATLAAISSLSDAGGLGVLETKDVMRLDRTWGDPRTLALGFVASALLIYLVVRKQARAEAP